MKRPEILAPAGNFDSLKAAIAAGCDAVYLGGNMFGARAYSNNFNNEEMIEAVLYAHKYGVKVYVTVNTLIYEAEVKNFMKYIDFLYMNNVDAVIVQDIGMMDLIRQTYPDFEVHASTQMHIHNLEGVKLVEELGLARAVLARETSFEEIKRIKENTNIELEIFVHGALCICYSGQCLMSSIIGGRSGNKGTCAQPCRQKYDVIDKNNCKVNKNEYNLSTKDLNTLEYIGNLIDIGVDSLKIEGRMKSPSYVYLVVSLYKKAVDSYIEKGKVEISEKELENLMVTFNRMYTKGFIFGEKNNDFINSVRPNHQGIEIGKVVKKEKNNIFIKLIKDLSLNDGIRVCGKEDVGFTVTSMFVNNRKTEVAKKGEIVSLFSKENIELGSVAVKTLDSKLNSSIDSLIKANIRKVKIYGKLVAKEGEKLLLKVSDGNNEVIISGDSKLERANNNPTTFDRIKEQLNKTGNSEFSFSDLTIVGDNNLFIPIKELNEIRRKTLSLLTKKRLKINRSYKKEEYKRNVPSFERKMNTNLYVEEFSEYQKINLNDFDRIYIRENLYKDLSKNEKIYPKISRVISNYVNYNKTPLVGELGGVYKYKNVDTDFSLNVVNSYSVALLHYLGAKKITLSYELNDKQIEKMINNYVERYKKYPNLELIIYSKEEMMISKFNLIKYYNLSEQGYLKDKFSNKYLIKEYDNLMYIYNFKPRKIDNIMDYYKIGINNFRINIVDEKDLKK